jgi:hypothetical protein
MGISKNCGGKIDEKYVALVAARKKEEKKKAYK